MFQIRPEQVQALARGLQAEANQRLVTYARERFPSEFQDSDDPAVLELVKTARAAARLYGIEREDDVATFLDLMVMYGRKFPRSPWAADILSCKALHGPDKMAILRHRVEETGVQLQGGE